MNNNSLYEVFDNGGVRAALIGALCILSLFLLAQTISTATGFSRSGIPATDTITVQGDGQAALPPDVAKVSFTVQNTAATVAYAQTATTKQANAAIDYVKGQGIDEKDIKMLSYNISPQYSYPDHSSPKVTGYQVSETVQVTMRDLTLVGAMLGGLGKLEVQNINGPAFTLDDSTAGYDAARADAIDKAKKQATLLAKQLGVRLGKIINFSESSGGYAYPMTYSMKMADSNAESVPNIPIGENTYSASVSITYEIH